MILGIDEVGRGAWAGPLVVGAVVLGGVQIEGLTDSKMLSKKRRELLHDEIYEKAGAVGLGWVSASEIDGIGLAEALRLATERAVREVKLQKAAFSEIIIDGTVNFLSNTSLAQYVTLMKRADLLVPSVSAASIVAKVARDRWMADHDVDIAGYGFAGHVGYGTAAHRSALDTLGPCELHRMSFAPLKKYQFVGIGNTQKPPSKATTTTTRAIGDASEDAAAHELMRRGHEIIERNWKTKYCEIDIVSRYNNTYYFTEVKHRKSDRSGDGLAAITPKKLSKMSFAAKFYAHTNNLHDSDMRLLAIATTGDPATVVDIVDA